MIFFLYITQLFYFYSIQDLDLDFCNCWMLSLCHN